MPKIQFDNDDELAKNQRRFDKKSARKSREMPKFHANLISNKSTISKNDFPNSRKKPNEKFAKRPLNPDSAPQKTSQILREISPENPADAPNKLPATNPKFRENPDKNSRKSLRKNHQNLNSSSPKSTAEKSSTRDQHSTNLTCDSSEDLQESLFTSSKTFRESSTFRHYQSYQPPKIRETSPDHFVSHRHRISQKSLANSPKNPKHEKLYSPNSHEISTEISDDNLRENRVATLKNPVKAKIRRNKSTPNGRQIWRRTSQKSRTKKAVLFSSLAIIFSLILFFTLQNFLPKFAKNNDSLIKNNNLPRPELSKASSENLAKNSATDSAKSPSVSSSTPNPLDLQRDTAAKNLANVDALFANSNLSDDTIFKLNIPLAKQLYRQSCEPASLKMALGFREVATTELAILQALNYDDQPATRDASGSWHWGDPHEVYVGFKDGDQTQMTGYGVFAEPIAKVSKALGRAAEVKNNPDETWLANQIYAGNPVVLWGVSIKIADAKWITPDGRTITAPMRTHTRLVIGVRGDPKHPVGFYVNDPGDSTLKYFATADLLANIRAGINQAVAIY